MTVKEKLIKYAKRKKEMMKKQLGIREELNSTNEKRTFYRSLLQIKHGYQPKLNACRDKQGKIIAGKEVTNRWAEHFEELLQENDKEENIQRLEQRQHTPDCAAVA
jgi:hypothetical protein